MSFEESDKTGLARITPAAGAWLLGGLVLAGAAAYFPARAGETLAFVATNLLLIAPVIGFAVVLTGVIRASGADSQIAKVFAGRRQRMIVVAALVGALTPICGVGVLPIIAGLLGAGVPLAPIMAFWLASPITDPAMLAVTVGTLGLAFAVAKTAAAFAIGLAGGVATDLAQARGHFATSLKPWRGSQSDRASEAACAAGEIRWRFWREPARTAVFLEEARRSGLLMVKWLTLAFALESLLRTYLPADLIANAVGVDNAWAIPVAVLIGTPLYLDAYAALPLVRGLMDLGMAPGAAMAFLVSGGITSLYAAVAVFALVRLPLFVWYLGLAVLGSAMAGYAFETVAVL